MRDRDDDRFRPRVAPPKARRGGSTRFVSRVLRSASRAGTIRLPDAPSRGGARRGRGHAAAAFAARGIGARSRRVVIKTRLVVLKQAAARSTIQHLRYIERDGVTREGKAGQAYDALCDRSDTAGFEKRGQGDRHQFRFIVSAEDAEAIGDLRTFTRHLMSRMEADLGTRLDWVAVDHWDTDNPHTHVVLRGKDEAGQDLVIARDYIARGMRCRASGLATEWLGPRTDLEIQEGQLREVGQERWTGLDRTLQEIAKDGVVDRSFLAERADRSLLLGRLQKLAAMGLADEERIGVWRLKMDVEPTLRAMGERGDIVRTMQRALGDVHREFVVTSARSVGEPVVGRVIGKGFFDEIGERGYIVVDALDGRAHYVGLPAGVDLADVPIGSIVDARPSPSTRRIDEAVSAATHEGVYSTQAHRASLAGARDPERTLDAAVRRLEALRRARVVDRLAEGVWRVPGDFRERAAAHERDRSGGLAVTVRSAWPIERQVRAIGATWLDGQLLSESDPGATGFGGDVRTALVGRRAFLVEQGLGSWRDGVFVAKPNLLATLKARELENAADAIRAETGLVHRSVGEGDRVAGTYRRSVLLASGRFALLDDGAGFSLVPWRPVIERRLGQGVSGVVRGGDVSWSFSRQRGLGIG